MPVGPRPDLSVDSPMPLLSLIACTAPLSRITCDWHHGTQEATRKDQSTISSWQVSCVPVEVQAVAVHTRPVSLWAVFSWR
jgi:hypothetical protein